MMWSVGCKHLVPLLVFSLKLKSTGRLPEYILIYHVQLSTVKNIYKGLLGNIRQYLVRFREIVWFEFTKVWDVVTTLHDVRY